MPTRLSHDSGIILIAENDGMIGLDLQDTFESVGYAVAGPFPSCADAVIWLHGHTPDIAVLDIHLRDGACTELARELTRLKVPFAVYSGEFDRNKLTEFKDAVWIAKPAPQDMLLEAVFGLRRAPEQWNGGCYSSGA
jgi:DNA-binding response OmpR family regulator